MNTTNPYHPGEVAAHRRAGLVEGAERVRGVIGNSVPPAAAAFLAEREFLVVAGADRTGSMWASLLAGRPGFARTPTPTELEVSARPLPGDPLAETLEMSARVGVIALDPGTRRRMRINGRSAATPTGLHITADQVYANCPKYIQARSATWAPGQPARARRSAALSAGQQASIAGADTFFVATRSAAGDADASHRGGNPGFVQVLGDGELRWPDYSGNAMLMTLGNLQEDSSAGLLFLDWENGATLQVTGHAEVEWDGAGELPGAERTVRFSVRGVVEREHGSPLVWGPPAYSRHNPELGDRSA